MYFELPDKLKLYYEFLPCTDKSDAPHILWLNGLTQSTLSWKLITPFFEETHHQIFLDFIFQGQSDAAPVFRTFEQHAQDVLALLDYLNVSKVHIAGISYGGAVTLRCMHFFPERIETAILISSFAYKTPFFEAIGELWKKTLVVGGYELLIDAILPFGLGASYFAKPVIPLDLLKHSRLNQMLNPENVLALMRATEVSENYLPVIEGNLTKTLIIHGEEDFLCPVQFGKDIHSVLPNSQLKIITKAGHTLNLEAVPRLAQLIHSIV